MVKMLIDMATSEIQNNPVSVSSCHPRREVEGEYGFVVTRELRGMDRIIWESQPNYDKMYKAVGAGNDFVDEIRRMVSYG